MFSLNTMISSSNAIVSFVWFCKVSRICRRVDCVFQAVCYRSERSSTNYLIDSSSAKDFSLIEFTKDISSLESTFAYSNVISFCSCYFYSRLWLLDNNDTLSYSPFKLSPIMSFSIANSPRDYSKPFALIFRYSAWLCSLDILQAVSR